MDADLQERIQRKCEAAKASALDQSKRAEMKDGVVKSNVKEALEASSRLHFAVSTLLYATLSILKVDDLEKFIYSEHCLAHRTLFDLEDYKETLESAKSAREIEIKRLANQMFRGELSQMITSAFTDLRGRVNAVDKVNRLEIHAMQQGIAELRSQWQIASPDSSLVQAKLLRQQNEALRSRLALSEKQSKEEIHLLGAALSECESVMSQNFDQITHLEEMYTKIVSHRSFKSDQRSETEQKCQSRPDEWAKLAGTQCGDSGPEDVVRTKAPEKYDEERFTGPPNIKAALDARSLVIRQKEDRIAELEVLLKQHEAEIYVLRAQSIEHESSLQ